MNSNSRHRAGLKHSCYSSVGIGNGNAKSFQAEGVAFLNTG